jgi:hypothetical protein
MAALMKCVENPRAEKDGQISLCRIEKTLRQWFTE